MGYSKRAIVLLILLVSVGCMGSESERVAQTADYAVGAPYDSDSGRSAISEGAFDNAGMEAPAAKAAPEVPMADGDDAFTGDVTGQQVIYSGTIQMEVQDFDDAYSQLKAAVDDRGGFISDSNIFITPAGKKRGTITVRVPQERFQDLIGEVSSLGTVETTTTGSEDVTLEYTDLNSRLSNLQKQEQRLLELLDRAENISEVLAVEKEVERVRGEIERIQGRLNYLDNRIDLSTLVVTFHEPEPIETQPVQFWADMEAKDLEETFTGLESLAKENGGYISSARIDESDPAAKHGSIRIDIPQNNYNTLFESVKALGKIDNQRLEGIPRDDASPASRAYLYLEITEHPSIVRQVINQDYGIDDSIRMAVRGFVQTLKTLIEAFGLLLPTAILALAGYVILKVIIKEGLKKYLIAYLTILSLLSIESGGGILLILLVGYLLYDVLKRKKG